jgi:hypothetical protein
MPGASALTIRLVTDHDIADPSAHNTPTVSFIDRPGPLGVAGTIFASVPGMANPAKRRVRKTDPAKISRKMRGVRPLRDVPQIGRRYDPGFKEPPETKSPWQDEGRPEASG